MARRRHVPSRGAGVAADAPAPPAHAEVDRHGQVVIREGPRATGRSALLWDHRGPLFAATVLSARGAVLPPVPRPQPPRRASWWRRHGLVVMLLVWAVVATVWR